MPAPRGRPPSRGAAAAPSSSGSRWAIAGTTPITSTPVRSRRSSGPGASSPASPRNRLSTNPHSRARSAGESSAQVPYRWAKAPPRSMSATSATRAPASAATRMLDRSVSIRLISAGLPAPSITSSSCSAPSERSESSITGHRSGGRSRQPARLSRWSTFPRTTTWLRVSPSGLTRTGFIRTSGTTPAAGAWRYCAVPISPPSTTRALLDMFCALNGATRRPRRAASRATAVVSRLLPAQLVVPWTMTALMAPGLLGLGLAPPAEVDREPVDRDAGEERRGDDDDQRRAARRDDPVDLDLVEVQHREDRRQDRHQDHAHEPGGLTARPGRLVPGGGVDVLGHAPMIADQPGASSGGSVHGSSGATPAM